MVENLKGEYWKQYKDTGYYFSNMGRVKRINKNKKERLLTPVKKIPKKGSSKFIIKIYGKEKTLAQIIYELFNGPIPKGYAVVHRNKVISDNSAINLMVLSAEKLGIVFGGQSSKRRLVYDIDNNVFYKGTREAAKALHISRQTVSDYCNGKVKKPVVNIRWAKTFE